MTGSYIDGVTSGVSSNLSDYVNQVGQTVQNIDVTDPQAMLSLQMDMMKMNMAVQAETAVTKSMEDTLKSVTQRM